VEAEVLYLRAIADAVDDRIARLKTEYEQREDASTD